MTDIKFHILQPDDNDTFQLIAKWYSNEWKIPMDNTIQRLKSVTDDRPQFLALMTLDGSPVSTGGLYNHVGLLDKKPGFKIYKNCLALVYTIPEQKKRLWSTNLQIHPGACKKNGS